MTATATMPMDCQLYDLHGELVRCVWDREGDKMMIVLYDPDVDNVRYFVRPDGVLYNDRDARTDLTVRDLVPACEECGGTLT